MEDILERTDAMLLIDKSDWIKVKFGEVAIQQKKSVDRENTDITRYVKGEHMGSEDLHLRDWGELQDEYLGPAFIRYFEDGDILYGSRRTYLRKVAIAPFEGITSNTTFVIKANEDKIDKRLLPFVMMSEGFTNHSIKNSKGSVNPYVNWKDLASYEFLLPPKAEQGRLVDLLWAMDEVIEKEKKMLTILQTTLKALFSEKVNNAPGRSIPLSQILKPKKGKSFVPHERSKYIGLEHIETGADRCSQFGDSSTVLAQCHLIDVGDLCYSKLRPYLDKAFIADFEAVSTTELLVYDTQHVSKDYVLKYFHSDEFLRYVSGKTFGTKMPRVSHSIIGDFRIKVLEKEREFLQELSIYERSKGILKAKISTSQTLLKTLINQIF